MRQVAAEEAELKRRERQQYEWDIATDNIPPADPVERAAWEKRRREELEEIEQSIRFMRKEQAELQTIRDDRPVGVPPATEPRTIHSPIPQPPWKRKLRP